MADEQAPLFLLGAPRSGTSLLYKALCLHPGAAWVSNWVQRFPGAPQIAVLNRAAAAFPGKRRRVWFGGESANAYVYTAPRRLGDRLFPMPVEGEAVFRRCGVPEDAYSTGRDRAEALRAAFTLIERFGGGRLLVCKRIANNRRIPLLRATFPSARFVEIVRDGRAVASSLSKVDWWPGSTAWWCGRRPREWMAEGGDPWTMCARSWVEELGVIADGLRDVPSEQVLRTTYEGLVSAPVPTLERVAAFAGLAPDGRWLEQLRRLSFPDRNDVWREVLSPHAVAQIESVQRQALVHHGYA